MRKEDRLHKAVADYIKLQYPKVMFNVDLSGLSLTPGMAKRVKGLRSKHKYPDMVLYEPRGAYHGLFIELKNEISDVYLKDEKTLKASDHIKKQDATLTELKTRGYFALFGFGFDHCKKIIDYYLALT